MKNVFKRIGAVLLAVTVFFATTGFHVFQHRCNHSNTTQTSILFERSCCCLSSGDDHCTTHSNKAICKPEKCCQTDKSYHKLTTPVELPGKVQPPKILQLVAEEELNAPGQADYAISETHIDYLANAPPKYGKEFLFFTRQLKLSPPHMF